MIGFDQRRRGVILLDVILGITLIAIAGVALVALMSQNFMTVDQLRRREQEIVGAAEQLERMSAFWSAGDFEAHRGWFRAGGFAASVLPIGPNLFDVAIADTATGVVLLRTTMYAVEGTNDTR